MLQQPTCFRRSQDYRIIPLERLSEERFNTLFPNGCDSDLYGIGDPVTPGRPVKSLTRDVALTLLTLDSAGPMPAFLPTAYGPNANSLLELLVLEGLVEALGPDGFLSGPPALKLFFSPNAVDDHDVSTRAIRDAIRASALTPRELIGFLYSYNRVANSTRWRHRWPDQATVAQDLGFARMQEHRAYTGVTKNGWQFWHRKESRNNDRRLRKLYVCVAPRNVVEAIGEVFTTLADLRPFAFKVGATVSDLLRPDKLMLYYESSEAMRAAALSLDARLRDLTPHEVPFTAALDGCTNVSWGMDLGEFAGSQLAGVDSSWRMWVCERVASAVVDARIADLGLDDSVAFVTRTLRLSGIDSTCWSPVEEVRPV